MQAAAAAVEARASATATAADSTIAEISKQEKKAKQVIHKNY
jgi:hypothetical protein